MEPGTCLGLAKNGDTKGTLKDLVPKRSDIVECAEDSSTQSDPKGCKSDNSSEMSNYISSIKNYHELEMLHAGYLAMIGKMVEIIRNHITKLDIEHPTILEIGCGTGLFTKYLAKQFPYANIIAVDKDETCLKYAKEWLMEESGYDLSNHTPTLPIQNVQIVQGDAIKYRVDEGAHIATSSFAHHHIPYGQEIPFRNNVWENLNENGIYVPGDEILPFFSNDDERLVALEKFHRRIIDIAVNENNHDLIALESEAWCSGIYMRGDFKRHKSMFEAEMTWGIADFMEHIRGKMKGVSGCDKRRHHASEKLRDLIYSDVARRDMANNIMDIIDAATKKDGDMLLSERKSNERLFSVTEKHNMEIKPPLKDGGIYVYGLEKRPIA